MHDVPRNRSHYWHGAYSQKSEHPFSPAITSLPYPALRLVFHYVIVHTHTQGKNIANMEMEMGWNKRSAYSTGSVDQELLRCNAYLVTENHILRKRFQGRVRLNDGERKTLAEMGKQLG